MKKALLLCILILSGLVAQQFTAIAEAPKIINYQAALTNEDGSALTEETAVTFSFYDEATNGNLLWTELHQLTPQDGFINVYLGTINPINLDFDEDYYLEIKIGDGTPYPRTALSTVPYSMYALTAEHAKTADIATTVEDRAITQDKLATDVQAQPIGVAGGVLSGQYPNPTLRSGTVGNQHIQDLSVSGDKIMDRTITADHLYGAEGSTNDVLKIINASTGEVGWGTLSPGGAASGDLGGTYPSPVVNGIKGYPINQANPYDRQVLMFDALADEWKARYLGVRELNATFISGERPNTTTGNGAFLYYRYGGTGDTNKLTWSMAPTNNQVPVWNDVTKTFYWTDIASGSASTLDEAYEGGNAITVDAGTPVRINGIGSDGSPELEVNGDAEFNGPFEVNGSVTVGDILSSYNFTINGNNVVHEGTAIGSAIGSDVTGTFNNLQIEASAVTAAEIATDGVGADEIATGAVGSDEIATNAVGTDEIANGSIIPADINTSSTFTWTGQHSFNNGADADMYHFNSDVPPSGNNATVIAQNQDGTGLALKVIGNADVSANLNVNSLTLVSNLSAADINIDGTTIINSGGNLAVGTGLDGTNLDLTATYDWTGSHTWTDANNLEYVFYSNVPANANDAAVQIRNDNATGLALYVNGNEKVADQLTVGNNTLNDNALIVSNNSGGNATATFSNTASNSALSLSSPGGNTLYINNASSFAANAIEVASGNIDLMDGIITNLSNAPVPLLMLSNGAMGGGAIDASNNSAFSPTLKVVNSGNFNVIDASSAAASNAVMKLRNTSTGEVINSQGASTGSANYFANTSTGRAIYGYSNSASLPTLQLENINANDGSVALKITTGAVVLSYVDATGVTDLSNYGDYSIIQITANIVTPPTGTDGQVLYLYNSDVGSHTFDGGTIQAGDMGTFISIGGSWIQVNDSDD